METTPEMGLGSQPRVDIRTRNRGRRFHGFRPPFCQGLQSFDVHILPCGSEESTEVSHGLSDADTIPGTGSAKRLGCGPWDHRALREGSHHSPNFRQEPIRTKPPTCLIAGVLPFSQQRVPRERAICE
ncbi:hypothetical protein D3C73_1222340 [compost metagenome]